MKSKRRYKIWIGSVFLGELEAFRKYNGFSDIFSNKILGAIEPFMNMIIFLIPLFITFLNPKILGFLFLRKLAQQGE